MRDLLFCDIVATCSCGKRCHSKGLFDLKLRYIKSLQLEILEFLLLQGAVLHGKCGDLPAGCGPPGNFPTPTYPPHYGSHHVLDVFLNP